ncbi:MAG: hypothetical protein ACK4GN_13205 [Runella sp.]
MKTRIQNIEPDYVLVNQPLPEADKKQLSEIIAASKKQNSRPKKAPQKS